MKRNAAIKLMIIANQPATRVRGGRSCHLGTKLELQKFQTHRFTPKIQVLEDGDLGVPRPITASEWQQMGEMVHVIHRIMPRSVYLLQTLPNDLC